MSFSKYKKKEECACTPLFYFTLLIIVYHIINKVHHRLTRLADMF